MNRQIKEDIKYHEMVLRRFERLIASNNKEIIELKERLEIYEEERQYTRCNCNQEEKES
jgi:hypothetical protein